MMSNILSILKSCIMYFVVYTLLAAVVNSLIEYLPHTWDRTGWGMLVLIILFLAYIVGAFKIGAAYSHEVGSSAVESLFPLYKRPIRSFKYGFISVVICLLLFYAAILFSSYM